MGGFNLQMLDAYQVRVSHDLRAKAKVVVAAPSVAALELDLLAVESIGSPAGRQQIKQQLL